MIVDNIFGKFKLTEKKKKLIFREDTILDIDEFEMSNTYVDVENEYRIERDSDGLLKKVRR